jgi:hypothetical protein
MVDLVTLAILTIGLILYGAKTNESVHASISLVKARHLEQVVHRAAGAGGIVRWRADLGGDSQSVLRAALEATQNLLAVLW